MAKVTTPAPEIKPLDIARRFGVPLSEVYVRLGVSQNRARQIARDPRHARRVFVAELEAALEQQKLELSLESLFGKGLWPV
jgi:hypothetical protein